VEQQPDRQHPSVTGKLVITDFPGTRTKPPRGNHPSWPWRHPNLDMPNRTNTLSLEQRLDIALDIIDALDYLHNHCQTPIVHCDLKPSNILLAEDMSARVGDFGISRILLENASKTLQNSNSTNGIRGSIGYVAPGN